MKSKLPEIIVTGDVCVNLLEWQDKSSIDNTFNYNLYTKVCKKYEMGGALLLSRLVEQVVETEVSSQNRKSNICVCWRNIK